MNNAVKMLVLLVATSGFLMFNASANAEQVNDTNTVQVQEASQELALNADANLNLDDEASDSWRGGWGGWGGGWGGWGGGWGGWGGCGCGYLIGYVYLPWFGGCGCGGWGW